MDQHTIFYSIAAILVASYVFGLILDKLNASHRDRPIPAELSDIYDQEQYRKQQEYEKTKSVFGLISGAVSFAGIMAMLFFDGFAYTDTLVSSWTGNALVASLLFFGVLMFASDILSTPFDIYGTFVIEERFGFNKMTPKIFVMDKLKGWALGAVIGGGVLALIIWFIEMFPTTFWLYAWAVMGVIMIFMAMFYSSLIVPLFNKQTPLEDGALKDAINAFSSKVGFKLDNIFVIDGSKRSTKANAYFSGLGAKKRIVLYDTLINDLTTDEIVAVLAHEVGHYKRKHTLSMIAFSLAQTGLMFYILSLFIANGQLSFALGASEHKIHLALVAFGILYSPLSSAMGMFISVLSRKNEYEADHYAAEHADGALLIGALKKLTKNNLSNLTPHPLYVYFHYSHPTLLQRMRAMGLAK